MCELKQPRHVQTIIPNEDIVAGCLQDIITWNNSEHSKIKGMSRWDVFLSMQNPNLRPTNYHGILPYLGYKETSSVHAGIMNFRSSKYLLRLDGIAFDSGYESLSGFNDMFKNITGFSLQDSKNKELINLTRLETDLGTMIACATEKIFAYWNFLIERC